MKLKLPTKKLGEIVEINPSKKDIASLPGDTDVSFIPMQAIDEEWGRIKEFQVQELSRVKDGYTYFAENDVLFAKITPSMENGKMAIARNLKNGIGFGTTEFHIIRTSDQVLPEWVYFIIRRKSFRSKAEKFMTGSAGQQRVPKSYLENVKIPLPPRPVQQKIVERLDAIRKAQDLNEKQISLANELFQSLLHEELKPKKAWEVKKFKDVTTVLMGQSPPSKTYNTKSKGLPFLQGKAEFGEIYPVIEKYCSAPIRIANHNDVLLSVRAPVGPVNLAPMEVCIGRGLSAIRGKRELLNQMFLFFFMKLNEIRLAGNAVGSTFSSISKKDVENIKIPLPPLKIQHQIVKKLSAVQDYKKKLLEQKELLQELFESVLDKSMKGELL